MASVFIDGGHGTTGLEIRERLSGRSDVTLVEIEEAKRKDATARRQVLNDVDVAILCLPDDAAREAVALIDNDRTCVIDASTAYRTAEGWTYGFHEIFEDGLSQLCASKRVSNPGCYPTGFLALVKPLTDAGLLPRDWPLTVNAVSGYSGGGKAMIAEFEGGGTDTSWRTYALGLAHKHVPEMQLHAGLAHAPLFAPSVARAYRGMIVEVPLMAAAMPKPPEVAAIKDALRAAFEASRIVNLVEDFDETNLTVEHAANTERLDLFVFSNADESQIRLIAALDNLGKGAGGAAVQSLNLLIGADELTGLRL
jgi:N-acetyl-gamma-glutamyl-phosphate reductase